MIGVFDSGIGGLCSFKELRKLLPREDLIYLADRKNAPYGTKSEKELLTLVRRDIKRLRELGAEDILVACCTASSICKKLSKEEMRRVIPIIEPTADYVAGLCEDGSQVTVIATNHTVSSKAFSHAIHEKNPTVKLTEIAAQKLVSLVEAGNRDGRLSSQASNYLDELCRLIAEQTPGFLILGCTHFSHLKEEISKRLPGCETVSPAALGAIALVNMVNKSKDKIQGSAKSLYTE